MKSAPNLFSQFARALLGVATLASASVASAQFSTTITMQKRYTVAPTGTSYTDLDVTCPATYVAMSGGVDHNTFTPGTITLGGLSPMVGGTASFFLAAGSHGAPTGYRVTVRNTGSTSVAVTAVATCAKLTGVVTVVSAFSAAAGTAAAPDESFQTVACPSGHSAIGGGGDFVAPGSMALAYSAPRYSGAYTFDRAAGTYDDEPIGWTTGVRNSGSSTSTKMSAICAPGADLRSVVSATQTQNLNSTGYMTVDEPSCPAGYIGVGGGIDSASDGFLSVAGSTPVFGTSPVYPASRADGQYDAPKSWGGGMKNWGLAAKSYKTVMLCAPNFVIVVPPILLFTTTTVIEFYNTSLKHYFRTSSSAEAAAIDGGSAGAGWVRTGDNFTAYTANQGVGNDVCRFYTFGANSHFYTGDAAECAGLKAPSSGWVYEGLSFRIPAPTAAGCAAGQTPVYRLYNNRAAFTDSNHRFTTRTGDIASLVSQGWINEGIRMCAL